MAGYYTGTINKLLETINFVSQVASEEKLVRMTGAYEAVLLAKVRAMGANGFGKGEFKPDVHRRFVGLIGQQEAFLKTIESVATAEEKAFAESVLHGPVTDEVERLRDIAIKAPSQPISRV